MDSVTRWAEERQAVQIALGVTETNLGVLTFYEHLGYVDIGLRAPLPSNPTLQVVVMARRLRT
jgi:hypothetical protein